jgi:hypothetical protein
MRKLITPGYADQPPWWVLDLRSIGVDGEVCRWRRRS